MTFERIATFVLDNGSIPESALDMAATLLIDTIGVAAGAAELASGRIARDHAFARGWRTRACGSYYVRWAPSLYFRRGLCGGHTD